MRYFLVFLISAMVNAMSANTQHDYPAEWWKPVPTEGAPEWEILPQDAVFPEVILSKRGELGVFSNFAATPFQFHGRKYASVEGLWQSMLYPEGPDDPRLKFPGIEWKYTREQVSQMVAFEAKQAGELASKNMERMGIDWVSFDGKRFKYQSPVKAEHYTLIYEALWEKLRQNPKVKGLLLKTKGLVLRPDHKQDPTDPPEWRYFDLWMQIREKL